jgi:hypothetical protein
LHRNQFSIIYLYLSFFDDGNSAYLENCPKKPIASLSISGNCKHLPISIPIVWLGFIDSGFSTTWKGQVTVIVTVD